ncbi:putative peter pan protein [Trypanosoma cruzi]|uniref:Peter pan protein, putative n=2 Tax=Trypanosoma cruzi TaxID=5693 RepID=Q4DR96_TRYCC|nr:peter pan protein, putative [Trypanosoma cruzi]EAN95056.1 peter pan protein, putative [Trypanosoma cruzi]KAF8293119.1 putative peter pan protein [Trypanosoma cruzi]PWV18414.1 putative peter pan protein [Trypanosoma cruzi]RNC61698.1 putative peter pan protein [Trypanosoma cruzi]|eukprot:XP_816907.1 peter pan protein [Trypanosoma cruzi strain CL Brener]
MGKSKVMPGTVDTAEADKATPKSIIIYRGEVGNNVRALMHDWRAVFLPWSSRNLHGKNSSLKDFLAIASTFSVSHLQLFTAPSHGTSLRIMRFANGPTLYFRVLSFTLRHEIVATQRRPMSLNQAVWEVAPIVVLNNFTHPDARRRPEVPLLEATFRGMFPTVNIQLVKNSDIQRVCLFHYDHVEHLVEVRHYFINAKAVGVSKTVKKLLERRCPTKLGTLESIDDVLHREDVWSDTDGEGEEVPLAQPFRQHREQCRIKLHEIGPRLTLQLVKVTNGFAGGEVLFHRFESKTPTEVAENAVKVRVRRSEKAKRKAEQDENVRRKQNMKEERLRAKRLRREETMRQQAENPLEVVDSGYGADAE